MWMCEYTYVCVCVLESVCVKANSKYCPKNTPRNMILNLMAG